MNEDKTFDHEGKVLYRWTPTEEEKKNLMDDVADEYAILQVEGAISGIVVYGLFNERWQANPWHVRPLIRHLLQTRILQPVDLSSPLYILRREEPLGAEEVGKLKDALNKPFSMPVQVAHEEVEAVRPLVIVLGMDDSLESLSEEDMAKHGGARASDDVGCCIGVDGVVFEPRKLGG